MWSLNSFENAKIEDSTAVRVFQPSSTGLIATDKIQEGRYYRERIDIKSARVSALTGSVPRKMAKRLPRVSAPCWNRTHVAQLSAAHLNHLTTKP